MRSELQKLVGEMVQKEIPLALAKREFEMAFLREILSRNGGNFSVTAKQVGIHRNTLYRKIGQYSDQVRYPDVSCHDASAGSVV
jgi:DNA-binding NtrC family response regulator